MRLFHVGTTVLRMDTPEQVSRALAETVSRRLSGAGISQRDAASRAGIALTTLSRRLTGTSPFLATELAALAGLLGTTVSNLAQESETPDSERVA